MSYEINQLHPLFAAEFIGADLTSDPSPALVEAVNRAMAEFAVVVLRDQVITDSDQIRFSRKFGPLELPPQMGMRSVGAGSNRRISPEMYDVSNLDVNGDFMPPGDLRHLSNKANEEFHTDSSFNALPTKWSILSGRAVPPEGGDTCFVDTRAVYDALSPGDEGDGRSRSSPSTISGRRAAAPDTRSRPPCRPRCRPRRIRSSG